MNRQELVRYVAPLFARPPRSSTRLAVEHELVARDADMVGMVPIERVRAVARGAIYSPHLSFEPGGQVELSLPAAATPREIAADLSRSVSALRADCARVGVALDAIPVHDRPVPLQLRTPRYLAMQRHFDTIGAAGRRMMRATASTQVCLDWWPGGAGLEQWRLLLLAGPFLAAAYQRSSGADSRLATWLQVDPARTAFDDRLLHGADPVLAYADLAAHATPFVEGVEEHLTTLFPPVRPRGRYLEVRFLDVQTEDRVADVVSVLAQLLYDGTCRHRALAMVDDHGAGLAERWAAAAAGDLEIVERGVALADLALKGVRAA